MMTMVIGLVMVVEQPQNYWCFEWQQQYWGWVELLKRMVFGIAVGLVMVVEQPQNYWCFEWQQQYLGWVELLKMMVFGIAVGLVMVVEQPQNYWCFEWQVVGFGFGVVLGRVVENDGFWNCCWPCNGSGAAAEGGGC